MRAVVIGRAGSGRWFCMVVPVVGVVDVGMGRCRRLLIVVWAGDGRGRSYRRTALAKWGCVGAREVRVGRNNAGGVAMVSDTGF